MKTIAITGATGFVGRYLVAEMVRLGDFHIKLLSREQSLELDYLPPEVEVVVGDMLEPESLQGFLDEGCTVINLAYIWGGGEPRNITAINNLLSECKSTNIRRFIHCSTAAVVGRTLDSQVTEKTLCRPITEYGITKLKLEKVVLEAAKGRFDVAILRPTAIFGGNGEPLKKLAEDIVTKHWLQNYLKSCLFNRRRMNLVCIENVISAIIFLINRTEKLDGQTFIVSDDDNLANNFVEVERFLMKALDVPDYNLPRLEVPLNLLKFILACLGRNNINPHCNYSTEKLLELGFERPMSFESGMTEYAEWYRHSYLANKERLAT